MVKVRVILEGNKPKLIHFDKNKVKKNYSVSIHDQMFKYISNDIIEIYESDYIVLRSFNALTAFIIIK